MSPKKTQTQTLQSDGELKLIERISRFLPVRDDIIVSSGDDCAVVRTDKNAEYDLLFTSDPVIEGVHFTTDTPGSEIGRKAAGRVLSDIAAMGGEPLWGLADLAAPPHADSEFIDDICISLIKFADSMHLAIVGGDVAESDNLQIHTFASGKIPRGTAILRSGAKEGDSIFVTDSLGGSIAGKHTQFIPRISEGIWLRNHATAMIDLSDGLATDLRHILDASNTGAELIAKNIPISKAALNANDGTSTLDHALYDGEDFELLFTVPASDSDSLIEEWFKEFSISCTKIGIITEKTGILEMVRPNDTRTIVNKRGYEHFEKLIKNDEI